MVLKLTVRQHLAVNIKGGLLTPFFYAIIIGNHSYMDREQLKLRLRQLELAVDALKAEIYSDVDAYKNSPAFKSITDYDELHDDDDGYPD